MSHESPLVLATREPLQPQAPLRANAVASWLINKDDGPRTLGKSRGRRTDFVEGVRRLADHPDSEPM